MFFFAVASRLLRMLRFLNHPSLEIKTTIPVQNKGKTKTHIKNVDTSTDLSFQTCTNIKHETSPTCKTKKHVCGNTIVAPTKNKRKKNMSLKHNTQTSLQTSRGFLKCRSVKCHKGTSKTFHQQLFCWQFFPEASKACGFVVGCGPPPRIPVGNK